MSLKLEQVEDCYPTDIAQVLDVDSTMWYMHSEF